jgi:hypothetical protein
MQSDIRHAPIAGPAYVRECLASDGLVYEGFMDRQDALLSVLAVQDFLRRNPDRVVLKRYGDSPGSASGYHWLTR